MGCDIHPVVQFRRGGVWYTADLADSPHDGKEGGEDRRPLIEGRNYAVFSVLGNVRNFHGADGDEKIPSIQDRRGLPKDFEHDGEGDYDARHPHPGPKGTWMGEHSHGWVSLAELEAYPWKRAWTNPLLPGRLDSWPDRIIPWLRTLGGPEDVRVVFGFDS